MKKITFIIVISIFLVADIWAFPKNKIVYFQKDLVGNLLVEEKRLIIGDEEYHLYRMQDTLYIPLSTVQALGARIEQEEGSMIVSLDATRTDIQTPDKVLEQNEAYINDQCVYIGNLKTYSLMADNQILVPFNALESLWETNEFMDQYKVSPKHYNLEQYVEIRETYIANVSPYFLRISYKDLFWDGKEYIESTYENVPLEVGEIMTRKVQVESEANTVIHLTTLLQDVHGLPNEFDTDNPYGQMNTSLFLTYQKHMRLKELDGVFTPYIVKGKMRYSVGKFHDKEEVELWRGEKNEYYVVIDKQGKKINIPWNSIEIPGDLGSKWPLATAKQIEDYVNFREMESDTEYLVWTDLYRERTYVLKGSKENWKLEKVMICSSGRNAYLTPRGEFKLEYRIPYFGMGKGFMCKNAVVIFRDYMYHSILFDKTGNYVKEGKYQLGQRVSHGCVRLSEEDSRWFYKTVPLGSKVWIN